MTDLAKFVIDHTERGECQCGRCIDKSNKPDPTGHTVDMVFFKVALRGDESHDSLFSSFIELSLNWTGEFNECDPFDGKDHDYLELGGWLGDQGLALQYMALGVLLNAFKLTTPRSLLGDEVDENLVQQMAGAGLVTVNSHVAVLHQ